VNIHHSNQFVFLARSQFSLNRASTSVTLFRNRDLNQIFDFVELGHKYFLEMHHSNQSGFLPLLEFLVNYVSIATNRFHN
jgi:hypothetical protein